MGNKLSYPAEDLSGKVAVVTGGNTGIGYETAKALTRLGAHTFIACRSKERAEAALERMRTELGAAGKREVEGEEEKSYKVEFLPLDLSSFQSTTDFVRAFKEKNLPLHILINNAAVGAVAYAQSADGYETHLQVNHLSHMLLTLELLPVILDTAAASGDGRIVIVSSTLHYQAEPFNSSRLNPTEQQYKRIKAYNNSKLWNVMTGYALQRRLAGRNVTVSSLHPGYVQTEISRGYRDMTLLYYLQKVSVNVIGRNPAEGAATTLNCALNPDLNSGQHFYYDSCRPKQSSADSRNERNQEELWRTSFEILKDHLSPDTIEKYGPKDPPSEEIQAVPPTANGETNVKATPTTANGGAPVEEAA